MSILGVFVFLNKGILRNFPGIYFMHSELTKLCFYFLQLKNMTAGVQ